MKNLKSTFVSLVSGGPIWAAVIVSLSSCATAPREKWMAIPGYPNLRGEFVATSDEGAVKKFKGSNQDVVWILPQSGLSEVEARTRVRGKLDLFNDLLHPGPDPYYGKRPESPTCGEKIFSENSAGPGQPLAVIRLYATEGFVYGSCNPKLDVLKSQITWLYCPASKNFYEVKYFYPASRGWVDAPLAQCPSEAVR